ncbi:hypothetical protein IF1G_09463 [Cordyceps javanica]|uniref:Uncharacterized protein n=1 Tax=Cordyceps javanica TaxID=43265 RepID=A0A545UQZ7_9HYPO|nr:hypothetical protein IF1G_09463 [Cordyceps javanica]
MTKPSTPAPLWEDVLGKEEMRIEAGEWRFLGGGEGGGKVLDKGRLAVFVDAVFTSTEAALYYRRRANRYTAVNPLGYQSKQSAKLPRSSLPAAFWFSLPRMRQPRTLTVCGAVDRCACILKKRTREQ